MNTKNIIKCCNKLNTLLPTMHTTDLSEIKCEITVGSEILKTYKNVEFKKFYTHCKKMTKKVIEDMYKTWVKIVDNKLLCIWEDEKPSEIYLIKPLQFIRYDKAHKIYEFEYILAWE